MNEQEEFEFRLRFERESAGAAQAAPQKSIGEKVSQGALDFLGGAVRGAGSIGATALAPLDMARDAFAGKGLSLESNRARRADMDSALQGAGVDNRSLMYMGGKLGTEIAGTAGVGNLIARPVQALAGTRMATGAEPILDGIAKGLQSGGFRVGELAGTGAGAAARVGTGALTGGAAAGMVNPEDMGLGAAVGGALPGAIKGGAALFTGAAKGIRSLGGGASPEVLQLAKRAQDLGIQIPADRLVNSRPMNAVAAGLNYVPFSGRAATEDAMNSQLNRALSRTFGQDTPNITSALRKADDVLGGQFDKFLMNNTVRVDRQFIDDLAGAANQASRELGTDGASIIGKQVDEIIAKAGTGELDGQAAYNIKKTLDRIGKRNSPEAWYALDLKGKLMEALNRSVGQEKAQGFAGLRQQYGAMLELEKLAKRGAEGDISVARFANLKQTSNPQLNELADIAAQFVKPREGQHGAAQRAFVGLGGAYLGGLPGLAAGAAAGRATNMALNSQAMRGLLSGPVPQQAVEQPMGLLGMGAYRSLPLLAAQD